MEFVLDKHTEALKNLILNPGEADREGFTNLDKLIERNKAIKSRTEQEKAVNTVCGLFNDLGDFQAQDITLLFSYINRSELFDDKMIDQLLSLLSFGDGKLFKIHQKVEIVKFLLSKAPDFVPADLIYVDLAQLKVDDPWLFVSLIAEKSKDIALNLVKYYIENSQFNKTAFFNLLMKWFVNPEKPVLIRIYKEILPLLNDESLVKILKFKLSENDIRDIQAKDQEVNVIINRLSEVRNPELISKAEIIKVANSREAKRPKPTSASIYKTKTGGKRLAAMAHRIRTRKYTKSVNEYDRETVQIITATVSGHTTRPRIEGKIDLVKTQEYKNFRSSFMKASRQHD